MGITPTLTRVESSAHVWSLNFYDVNVSKDKTACAMFRVRNLQFSHQQSEAQTNTKINYTITLLGTMFCRWTRLTRDRSRKMNSARLKENRIPLATVHAVRE